MLPIFLCIFYFFMCNFYKIEVILISGTIRGIVGEEQVVVLYRYLLKIKKRVKLENKIRNIIWFVLCCGDMGVLNECDYLYGLES